MSRNPQLEAVFEARYAWENSTQADREDRLREYHRLLEEALLKAGLTAGSRSELEDALFPAYREFRHARRLEERARLARLR
jgi:hypothetical protein